ncbi:MAG TPA: alpha/beta hydrolase [Burkholderiales bacterium]|nr:alpha/beta hydrolase [Burkholderiales bacterium]
MTRAGLLFVFSLALAAPLGAGAEEIVTVSGRADATQSYLLLHDAPPPAAVAVLFPGGEGLLGLRVEGGAVKFRQHGNFLVRTRTLMRDRQVGVAIVDSPSDQQRAGMDDGFRTGRAHVADVAAVVKDLKQRFPGAKIFLIGTSRGTISAAYAGRALNGAIDGVILTSTVFYGPRRGGGIGIASFDFAAIKAPLLFVHHRYDGCGSCPYHAAENLGRTYPLITVTGGKPAESGPCEPFAAHGYFGKEAETVAAIRSWMLGQAFPKTVE